MNWIAKNPDAVLPEETRGAPAAGFRQWCRCGADFRSIRCVLPKCPRCGREGADAWKRVLVRHRGYPDIELQPDPQFLEALKPVAHGSSWGRRTGRKIAAWLRSWANQIHHPRRLAR